MRRFNVETCPYEKNEKLYYKKEVEFDPGLTVLVGCNGSGKSTLMMLLKEQLKYKYKNEPIMMLEYDDRAHGGSHLMEKFAFHDQFDQVAGMMCSSEGERIFRGVGDFATGLAKRIRKQNPKELWIFFDAIGSGMSIDNIVEIKNFAGFLVEQNPSIDVYVVVSTNEYEFAYQADCIDVTTFRHMTFEKYEDYKRYILKTRKKKDKRYEKAGS